MAQPTARHLSRLARLAADLRGKQDLCVVFQRLVEASERSGMIVAGERWILEQLQQRVGTAMESLGALQEAETTSQATDHLSELERILSDPEWDASRGVLADLKEQDAEREAMLRQYEGQLAEWADHIGDLKTLIGEARESRAPVMREETQVLGLEATVQRAERALRDRDFGALTEAIARLDAAKAVPAELSAGIASKARESGPLSRQADLLLLQSPLVDQTYEYTVLLRTPSEPGSHGVNIQDSSTLVRQDRQQMRDAVDEITRAINLGLARQFRQRSDPELAQAFPPTSDERADLAERAESQPQQSAVPQDPITRDLIPVDMSGERASVQSVNGLAQSVGDLMYRLLMPEAMQRYLDDTPCSVTITTNDLELPWELMWYRDDFLCLDRPVARMPMGRAFPREDPPRARGSNKLLFRLIYADPHGNLPAAEREVDQIKEGLIAAWGDQIQVDVLKGPDATGRQLNEDLRTGKYDVIHFAGHAAFNEQEPDLSGLLLHDEEVFFAQKTRRLLEGRPLVFLNACESGRTANASELQSVESYLQKPAEGLASSFVYGGALGCIGALWPVYDDAASEFAVTFYSRMLEGYMIGEAMRRARIHTRERFPRQITWAAFVLYGDPTFRLAG